MGADEKHAATYHGGEYTPSLGVVRESFALTRKGPLKSNSGATAYAEFDRMIAKVRAEAKAEALEEAIDALMAGPEANLNPDGTIRPPHLHRSPRLNHKPRLRVANWLLRRANQYKEKPANGR